MNRRQGVASIAFAAALSAACGTNAPELPPGFDAPASCVAVGYPDAPYGTEPGSVVSNACFEGWRSPAAAAARNAALEPISLADFFDRDGTGKVRILLINTAAVWCSACRVEHEDLPAYAARLGPQGLAIVSALFQDQARNPAEPSDLSAWAETFGTNFPMVIDPDYELGRYASAETAPLNLVVDARTMVILRKYIGDQAAVMWPFIEGRLAAER
jgi:hypothetical protein